MPALAQFSPRQQKAAAAVAVIRKTTEELIAKCKEIVEREQEFATLDSEYMNESDPSVLRFLLASRVEVTEQQLRDDLLSMLVAGHETTGSVLTWTMKLLVENPEQMAKATAEVRTAHREGVPCPLPNLPGRALNPAVLTPFYVWLVRPPVPRFLLQADRVIGNAEVVTLAVRTRAVCPPAMHLLRVSFTPVPGVFFDVLWLSASVLPVRR